MPNRIIQTEGRAAGAYASGPDIRARAGALVGSFCGLASALLLAPAVFTGGLFPLVGQGWSLALHLASGVLVGAAIGSIVRPDPDAWAATAAYGAVAGLCWWLVGPLTLAPLAVGSAPTWSADEAGAAFGSLIASFLHGCATTLSTRGLMVIGLRRGMLDRYAGRTAAATEATRVVIIGGGFGGVSAARRLEELSLRGPRLRTTLVSQSNALLFTPMLAEVASSALQAQHISAPVRAACPATFVRRAEVDAIDVGARVVRVRVGGRRRESIAYDHLVLALGSVPTFHGLLGLEEHAFTLKTLEDATVLRNHVISLLERADVETDASRRRPLLTFVVAGGGFAGTETIAELRDLVFSVLRYYPHVPPSELRFVLVHSRERILPELGASLADYALRRLRARGIEFMLETRVAGATAEGLLLDSGSQISTYTIVWTAGNRPHPLLSVLPAGLSPGGALVVDPTMRVPSLDNVWAIGDCAQVPDPTREGGFCPPTAQHAQRQGRLAAENIVAVLHGRSPQAFSFRTLGTLVALGHRTAVAEIRGRQFSGLTAWLLWRFVYLAKLPGGEKKLRVLIDWAADLVFPRDTVLTQTSERPGRRR